MYRLSQVSGVFFVEMGKIFCSVLQVSSHWLMSTTLPPTVVRPLMVGTAPVLPAVSLSPFVTPKIPGLQRECLGLNPASASAG